MTLFHPDLPFDLPLLPPKAELETHGVLKRCIEARAALAELKQAGELLPNQAVLINTIPLLEAQASSAIENIVTTTDRLFRYAHQAEGRMPDPATKEALRYGSALAAGFRSLSERPLSTSTAVAVCSAIKGVEMDIRRVPGTALLNDKTGRVVYTPPVGEGRLRDLLANWENYIHDRGDDIDPIVKLAILHYQFEAIHPFTDGNGRTGRIVNILYLIERGLLDIPVLYLSRYVLANRSSYYAHLQNVTERANWIEWIEFLVTGVGETARWTTAKIKAIRRQMDVATAHMREKIPSIYSRGLVDILFSQPYVRIANIVDDHLAKRQTASVYLQQLSKIGILRELKAGREKLFVHPALVRLLTTEENDEIRYDPTSFQ